jgi:hypothetical protein
MFDISTTLNGIKWDKKEPADPKRIQKLVDNVAEELPQEYLDLLVYSDGGEGELGFEPGWFQLWSSADVIDLNKSYEIDKNLPGYFGFGSNGGGELLAFDMKHGKPWKVVMIPFIPMEANKAIIIANDFVGFIQAMGRDL